MNTILITNQTEKLKEYICQHIQKAWNPEENNDQKKKKSYIKDSDYFRIIDSKEKFESLDKKFIPKVIFIIPELMWENDGVNEGYKVARELITHKYKDEFIQLVFISVLNRNELLKNADKRNIGFINAFPHVSLLDENNLFQFSYYSEIHYKLIKFLAISDQGRIQKIDHEINPIKSNVTSNSRNLINDKDNLIRLLEELSLFQAWSSESISGLIRNVADAEENNELEAVISKIENIIFEVKKALPSDDNNLNIEKSNYRVLIIEDQKWYRTLFYEVFSKHYHNVYPDNKDEILIFKNNQKTKQQLEPFSIYNAKEIIKTQSKKYQIIILDLLFKDEDGNWLDFNGLDLYVMVKKYNPSATIRIITSLPREIVAKIIETTIQEKVLLNQVFTKKGGDDALKYSIQDRIEEINNECKEKAKTKTVLSPFPKTGIFDWTGIPELMFDLLHERKEEYCKYRAVSQGIFNEYLKGTLDKNSNSWNKGELPKPAMKSKITDSYFLGKFSSIMTHRMIALNEALKNDDFRVQYAEYIDIIKGITNITQLDKGYFQTKLGFNGREHKEQSGDTVYFQISTNNLFPEEVSFIIHTLSEREIENRNKLLKDSNSDLNEFFKKILCELVTYENWDELGLDYNPYQKQKESIDAGFQISCDNFSDLTYKQLQNFLQSLIDNYSMDFIEPMATFVTDNAIGSDKIKNQSIEILINNLYSK